MKNKKHFFVEDDIIAMESLKDSLRERLTYKLIIFMCKIGILEDKYRNKS